jgi:putative oxygen-independent coproporphyrinogen III oxidase
VPSALPDGESWPSDNKLEALSPGERSFHAYVHIPFCEVRCGYCDFNTYTQDEIGEVSQSKFHEALVAEIEFSAGVLSESMLPARPLASIFFGGGTPSLFQPAQIEAIIDSLSERFGLAADCEVTLEANPESLLLEHLDELQSAGVNRISFGVQSFAPEVLQVLDRQHNPAKVPPLVNAAKAAGFRTSLDLIYGSPGESLESWQNTVAQAIELGTGHISAYSLIVEPGTKMHRLISSGKLAEVDEDLNAQKYELMTQAFESAGLEFYEVSNFGDPSRHNLAYWNSQDWWGYGPGAHSHIAGNRFWNRKHPVAYQASLKQGSPAAGIERLSERQRLEEELMLGLRTKFGVRRELFQQLDVDPAKVATQIGRGLLLPTQDRIVLTAAGRLLADGLVVDFLN